MNHLLRQFLIPLLLLSSSLFARDFETWAQAGFQIQKVDLCGEARFKESSKKAYYYYIEGNYHIPLALKSEFLIGYRHLFRKYEDESWKQEPVPMFAMLTEFQSAGFLISDRNRVEYRSKEKKWLYRNKLATSVPIPLPLIGFNPYCYAELFFKEGDGYSEERYFIGIKQNFFYCGEGQLGYLYRAERQDDKWHRTNVLYGILRLKF